MLRAYLEVAMRRAAFEYLPNDGCFYGEISDLAGVYATGSDLATCKTQLEEVLDEWVRLSFGKHLPLPVIAGIDLAIRGFPMAD